MEPTFRKKLASASKRNSSLVCIGLDPDPSLMPPIGVFEFNRRIIDATSDLVCAYKPNLAFYEALGADGLKDLERTVAHVPAEIPVIGDCKRADISSTSRAYAKAMFEGFGFDAVTVSPYLGHDSLAPFIEYAEKGVFVLCRTSNPGSADFQELVCEDGSASGGRRPLFEVVALRAKEWNEHGNIGLVVGATYADDLATVRGLCPDMPILVPGVGAQGGDIASVVRCGSGERGALIVSVSRQVLYAGGSSDFAEAAREETMRLRVLVDECGSALR